MYLMTREALVALGDAAAEAGWCFWSVTVADRLVEDAGGKTPRFTTATVFHATSLQPSRPGAPEVLRAHAPDGSHEVNVVQASHLVAARGADRGQGEEVSVLQPRGYPLVEDFGRVQHQVHQRRRRVRRRLGGIHRALARAFAAYRHLSRPVKCAAPFVRRDENVFSEGVSWSARCVLVNAPGGDPYRARAPPSRARWDASPAAPASTIPPTPRARPHRTRTRARRPPPRSAQGRRPPRRPIDAAARAII